MDFSKEAEGKICVFWDEDFGSECEIGVFEKHIFLAGWLKNGRVFESCAILDDLSEGDKFKVFSSLLMKWIAKNGNPHASILITNRTAEVVEGKISYVTDRFLDD